MKDTTQKIKHETNLALQAEKLKRLKAGKKISIRDLIAEAVERSELHDELVEVLGIVWCSGRSYISKQANKLAVDILAKAKAMR